jgi:hypothetical protein
LQPSPCTLARAEHAKEFHPLQQRLLFANEVGELAGIIFSHGRSMSKVPKTFCKELAYFTSLQSLTSTSNITLFAFIADLYTISITEGTSAVVRTIGDPTPNPLDCS